MVSLYVRNICSDVESHGSVTADEDDDDEDADGDIETEDQSSDDQDTGDIDELLDEALDKDNAETNVPADINPLVTKDSTPVAAAAPVSYTYFVIMSCRQLMLHVYWE